MNDKLKGLVLGLSIGVMMTGSIAYASGTQIEVYFKNIKYMFDGHQKKTAEESFIYNGTTYVPLRFVSEALGKEVQWDGDSETVWVGRKVDLETTAAVYKGGKVTLGELEKYIAVNDLLGGQAPTAAEDDDASYKSVMLQQLIANKIWSGRINSDQMESVPGALSKQMKSTKALIDELRGGQDAAVFLQRYRLTEEDVRSQLELMISAQKALGGPAEKAYDREVAANNTDYLAASVSHILISSKDEEGVDRTKAEIDKKLVEVQDKLRDGENFAKVAAQYSEDPGSKDKGGYYENVAVSDWVPEFKKAAIELPVKLIGGPIQTQFGYHIIRVESRGYPPFVQAPNSIKQKLINSSYEQFLSNELPNLIESVNLPKK
ncbi:peptidylprolyl isomerase [Paenibacillus piri]|uniref:Peptidylprolyl isomerase n=1 Tax=Paenibacillus piri TaxID=2547395 RepID=A0A4R5KW60_9BACL|nr:peptidylprolyl isomerase [Paenibacillus piri]TDF99408.1 peptidylprolyl isomerase [Paenibacillus piri]